MNTKQTQLTRLLLCLQRLEHNHNPNVDNGLINNQKNVELYKGILGFKYTIPNLRRIGSWLINKYNIKYMRHYLKSDHIGTIENGIQLSNIPQWQTYIKNPITPREYEKGIYTLEANIHTYEINTFVIGLSNQKIPKNDWDNYSYYYLSRQTQYLWLNLHTIDNNATRTITFTNRSLQVNKKLDTNDTITYDIFNRDKKIPPNKIKDRYGEDLTNPIVIDNSPSTTVKIIYHSYDHTIQYYINETLLCTIPAEIDTENMYPFIAGTSYNHPSTIQFE
jgi:hypothetical protein